MASSSSSSLSSICKYDIFTSFCEEDDCDDKISHLLAELECEKIGTFKGKMKRSKSVGPELVKEIRESRCLIVVLSKNYASSSRCLDELVEIMNFKEDLAQKVVPIFYNVVPYDVGKQTGDFGRVFENTCIGKSEDQKQKWVQALADIANIKGVDAQCDYDSNMIENLPQSFNGTEFSSSTATNPATTNSSVGRRSQLSEAVRESLGGIMSDSDQILELPHLKVYTFLELTTVTRNFRPDSVLGEGGFGKVYKGWIDAKTLAPSKVGCGMCVAVKRLDSEGGQGFEEWRAEVNFSGTLSHPNLLKLLGYCREDKELLLVSEFMPKGSLANHLFRRSGTFPWDLRIKIMIGAARGLAFLHDCQVIYRNFKPSIILLDSSYHAKISDLGLAKIGPSQGQSHITTRVMGTYGYAAPEYMATGHLYFKSDVYAFGVVLLEVMTGLKAYNPNRPNGQKSLVDWLRPKLTSKHRVKHIMDKGIKGEYSSNVAAEMGRIIVCCIEPDPRNRPHMKDVLDMLERIQGINVVSDPAPVPAPAPAQSFLGYLGKFLSF